MDNKYNVTFSYNISDLVLKEEEKIAKNVNFNKNRAIHLRLGDVYLALKEKYLSENGNLEICLSSFISYTIELNAIRPEILKSAFIDFMRLMGKPHSIHYPLEPKSKEIIKKALEEYDDNADGKCDGKGNGKGDDKDYSLALITPKSKTRAETEASV